MKYMGTQNCRLLVIGLAASALLAAVLLPPSAGAWTTTSRSGSSWGRSSYYGDSWGDARRMQSDGIAAQEEARREVARDKRRTEIAEEQKKSSEEYLASQAEIRAASAAAARAPQGSYYRKPGFTTAAMPGAAVEMKVGDTTFHYFSGIFYRKGAANYIVVPAPVGAVVDTLPEGVGTAVYKGDADTYLYYFGTFFTAEGDKFKVVAPPAGTLVGYVPDGYTEEQVGDSVRYQFGSISFKPAHFQDNLIYQVVEG